MSQHTEDRQGDLTDFAGRVGIVLGAALAFLGLITALWRWTPVSIRKDVDAAVAQHKADTARLDRALLSVISIVEIQATINAEEPGSPEYIAARAELKRLRRFSAIAQP